MFVTTLSVFYGFLKDCAQHMGSEWRHEEFYYPQPIYPAARCIGVSVSVLLSDYVCSPHS